MQKLFEHVKDNVWQIAKQCLQKLLSLYSVSQGKKHPKQNLFHGHINKVSLTYRFDFLCP